MTWYILNQIFFNHEFDQVRTTSINSFFSLIPEITSSKKEEFYQK